MTCNYYKVLVARTTRLVKFKELLDGTVSENEAAYHTSDRLTAKERHGRYMSIIGGESSLEVPYNSTFRKDIVRYEEYFNKCGNFNGNHRGEKTAFICLYNYVHWKSLSDSEQNEHSAKGCQKCVMPNSSISQSTVESPLSKEQILNSPVVRETIRKVKADEQRQFKQQLKSSPSQELDVVLRNNLSFSRYDRIRLDSEFIGRQDAAKIATARQEKENTGVAKRRNPVGNVDSYVFDRQEFLNHMKSTEPGSHVNWSENARKFDVRSPDGSPSSKGGQVLKKFAADQGIDTTVFNQDKTVSGRDIPSRIRRYRKILQAVSNKPTSRMLKQELSNWKKEGKVVIGESVAPKTFDKIRLSLEGPVFEKEVVAGRKIPLRHLIEVELKRQVDQGYLLPVSDEQLQNIDIEEIVKKLKTLNEYNPSMTEEETKNHYKKLVRQCFLKFWHDHGDVNGHPHVVFTVNVVYDPSIHQDKQREIEKPILYIFGRSGSSVQDQSMYSQCRLEDLKSLQKPVKIPSTEILMNVIPRFCTGDTPARCFETGMQIGGNYRSACGTKACNYINLGNAFQCQHQSIQHIQAVVLRGSLWEIGKIYKYPELSKDDMLNDVHARDMHPATSYYSVSKAELQELLKEELLGVQRLPALLLNTPQQNLSEISCQFYEVPDMEFMHDFLNVFEHVMDEVPHHLSTESRVCITELYQLCKGDRPKIRACDARRFAIKICSLKSKIDLQFFELMQLLVEISEIGYSLEAKRNVQSILRFTNLTFILAMKLWKLVGTPKKITNFYGVHFHNLTVHAPIVYRLSSLRSIVAEQEEALIYKLRSIAEETSSKKANEVISNCMIRIQYQQSSTLNVESSISKDSKAVEHLGNSIIPAQWISLHPSIIRAHLRRVSDYLLCGSGTWYQVDNGSIVFKDSQSQVIQEPKLLHYRSKNIPEVSDLLTRCWNQVVDSNDQIFHEFPRLNQKVDNAPTKMTQDRCPNKNQAGQVKKRQLPTFITGKSKKTAQVTPEYDCCADRSGCVAI